MTLVPRVDRASVSPCMIHFGIVILLWGDSREKIGLGSVYFYIFTIKGPLRLSAVKLIADSLNTFPVDAEIPKYADSRCGPNMNDTFPSKQTKHRVIDKTKKLTAVDSVYVVLGLGDDFSAFH